MQSGFPLVCGTHRKMRVAFELQSRNGTYVVFRIQWNVTNLICRIYGKVNLKAHEKSNCVTEILP